MARRVLKTQELRFLRDELDLRGFANQDDDRKRAWFESLDSVVAGFAGLGLSEETRDALTLRSLSHALEIDLGLDEWVHDHSPDGWVGSEAEWPEIRAAAAGTIFQMYLTEREREQRTK